MCAAATYAAPGRVGVLAHSLFYQDELAHRFDTHQNVAINTEKLPDAAYRCLIWAEPEQNTFAHVLDSIQQVTPIADLHIITSNPLAQRLPEWHTPQRQPATQPIGFCASMHALRQSRYQVVGMYGFHGPLSIAWGVLGQLMARIRRNDLADRCHFAMRLTYMVQGWQARLAPVSVISARQVRI
jgi:hypothetical protein